MIKENQKCTERFLKDICGVRVAECSIIDNFDLTGIIDTISNVIEDDIQSGQKIFFDLMGGESLPLVAFGILSRELSAPMRTYDIYSGQMHEYGHEGSSLLSELVEYDPISGVS